MSKKLSEYERKRNRKKTPEPFGGKRGRRRRRSSSCSGTTRGACTTTSASSATACSPRGRCRKACRSSRASSISPSTSRTIRSSTGASRARSRRATTAPAPSRSGITARTSSSRRRRDGGLTVRLHGERLDGIWTLVPAHLSGDEKNWLLLRKRDDGARAAPSRATSRCSRRSPSSCRRGDGWLFEPKWDGYRALAYVRGGEAKLVSRRGNDLTRAVRARREGAA